MRSSPPMTTPPRRQPRNEPPVPGCNSRLPTAPPYLSISSFLIFLWKIPTFRDRQLHAVGQHRRDGHQGAFPRIGIWKPRRMLGRLYGNVDNLHRDFDSEILDEGHPRIVVRNKTSDQLIITHRGVRFNRWDALRKVL